MLVFNKVYSPTLAIGDRYHPISPFVDTRLLLQDESTRTMTQASDNNQPTGNQEDARWPPQGNAGQTAEDTFNIYFNYHSTSFQGWEGDIAASSPNLELFGHEPMQTTNSGADTFPDPPKGMSLFDSDISKGIYDIPLPMDRARSFDDLDDTYWSLVHDPPGSSHDFFSEPQASPTMFDSPATALGATDDYALPVSEPSHHGWGGKTTWPCPFPDCEFSKPGFRRSADLERHLKQIHYSQARVPETFPCDCEECESATRRFHRRDHLLGHLRDFHREDIPKRGLGRVFSIEGWVRQRCVDPTWWRCNRCLQRIEVATMGWECPGCRNRCQKERRVVREEMEKEKGKGKGKEKEKEDPTGETQWDENGANVT